MRVLKAIRGGIAYSLEPSRHAVRFEVEEAEIMTGYFKNAMQPVVCLIKQNRIVQPNETLAGKLQQSTDRYGREDAAFVGILDASDEEMQVLRDAAYTV